MLCCLAENCSFYCYPGCHYIECRYDECHGTTLLNKSHKFQQGGAATLIITALNIMTLNCGYFFTGLLANVTAGSDAIKNSGSILRIFLVS